MQTWLWPRKTLSLKNNDMFLILRCRNSFFFFIELEQSLDPNTITISAKKPFKCFPFNSNLPFPLTMPESAPFSLYFYSLPWPLLIQSTPSRSPSPVPSSSPSVRFYFLYFLIFILVFSLALSNARTARMSPWAPQTLFRIVLFL
jgi:hypothetical protein